MVYIDSQGNVLSKPPAGPTHRAATTGAASAAAAAGTQRMPSTRGAAAAPASAAAGDSLLTKLEKLLGIHGKTLTVPSIGPVPSKTIPQVVLLFVALAVLLLGWKALAGAAILYAVWAMQG